MSESNLLQRLKMKGEFVDTSADGITIKDGFYVYLFVYGLCLLLSLHSCNREIELEVASRRVRSSWIPRNIVCSLSCLVSPSLHRETDVKPLRLQWSTKYFWVQKAVGYFCFESKWGGCLWEASWVAEYLNWLLKIKGIRVSALRLRFSPPP